MKRILSVLVLAVCMVAINACYWDNPPEPIPIDPEMISFQTHIIPIFNASCNSTGCHDDTYAPDLREENAWRELHSGYVNLTFPEESRIYTSVENGYMPPGGSLTETEKELILGWVIKGALND